MDEENITQVVVSQPSFRLHSPAVDFIENKLYQYHPAFDTRYVQFDASKRRFTSRTLHRSDGMVPQSTMPSMDAVPNLPSLPQQSPRPGPGDINDMLFWHEIFPRAMDMLNMEPLPCVIKDPAWKIRHFSTWSDVQGRLDMARQKYDRYSGPQQVVRFRRKLRSVLSDHAVKLQQATKILPDIDVSRPVIGAIGVVLDAYRQVSEVREEVTTSFDDLPEVLEKINFYLQTYPKDENIVSASCNLVCAIFNAIENAIAFYTSHQAKRAGMAILSGSEYQKILLRSLHEVKTRCNSLENQASMSLSHRLSSDNCQMMEQNASIMKDSLLMQHVLGSIHQDVRISNIGMIYLANLFNEVYPLLSGLEARESRSPMMRTPSPSPRLIREQPVWSAQDIWVRLCIPTIDEEDLRYITENVELMLHKDRGRAQQLLGTHQFRKWMASSRSTRLLVHGDFRPPFDISPFSVVCTILTHTFRNYGNSFVSLVFFCGRHQIWDAHRGGLAMIRSLIDQLLRQWAFFPFRPDPRMILEDLERDDIKFLCEVFVLLFQQLPSTTLVFCLVDGIGLYETEQYLDGMDTVIMSLVGLVEHGGYGGWTSFKLLITSPQPTVEVRKVFDPEPDTLLSMQGLSLLGHSMGLSSFREQLAPDICGTD